MKHEEQLDQAISELAALWPEDGELLAASAPSEFIRRARDTIVSLRGVDPLRPCNCCDAIKLYRDRTEQCATERLRAVDELVEAETDAAHLRLKLDEVTNRAEQAEGDRDQSKNEAMAAREARRMVEARSDELRAELVVAKQALSDAYCHAVALLIERDRARAWIVALPPLPGIDMATIRAALADEPKATTETDICSGCVNKTCCDRGGADDNDPILECEDFVAMIDEKGAGK